MSGLPEVVRATVRGEENVACVAYPDGRGFWCWLAGREAVWRTSDDVTDRRPLLLIDPEDAEQVEALLDGYLTNAGGVCEHPSPPYFYEALRKALRSLAEPTPPEPQGLGAVVRDADGGLHTKVAHACWVERDGGLVGRSWGELPYPVVVREGWSE